MNGVRRGFVAGCQRSGTTLLRLILGSHSRVRCLDEGVAYGILCGRTEMPELPEHCELVMYKIPRFTDQLLAEEVWDEVYGRVPGVGGDDPVLFLIRNPLDVVCSMIRLKDGSDGTWIERYGRAGIESRAQGVVGFSDKYAVILRRLAEQQWPEHMTAALYWRMKNEPLADYLGASMRILPVAYEDLVSHPEPIVREILQFLDLPWEETVLQHHIQGHEELDSEGLAIGGTDPTRPIETSRIGVHADVFNADQLREIHDVIGETWTIVRGLLRQGGPS